MAGRFAHLSAKGLLGLSFCLAGAAHADPPKVCGNDAMLGNFDPTSCPVLRDDGVAPDQAAGDGVYNVEVTLGKKPLLRDQILPRRLEYLGPSFDTIVTEFVGVSATHGPLSGDHRDAPEVQLRVGVRGQDKAMVERFTRELIPMVLNGPPSVTGFAAGRPKVEEIVAYWPALIDKSVVTTQVEVVR